MTKWIVYCNNKKDKWSAVTMNQGFENNPSINNTITEKLIECNQLFYVCFVIIENILAKKIIKICKI